MPWSLGVYTRGYPSWSADAASNLPISATKFDTEDNDFATGLNNCITVDGLNKPTAALSWGLASGQIMALTRGNDGTVFSVARTGGANNPKLSLNVTDASTAVSLLIGATTLLTLATGVQVGAPTGGDEGAGTLNVAGGVFVNGVSLQGLPQNLQSGTTYPVVLLDLGKSIVGTNAGAKTFTIPANASVAFPLGSAVTFINQGAGAMTIAITTDTLVFSPSGSTGSRTLANNGVATAIKVAATTWIISGTGLT